MPPHDTFDQVHVVSSSIVATSLHSHFRTCFLLEIALLLVVHVEATPLGGGQYYKTLFVRYCATALLKILGCSGQKGGRSDGILRYVVHVAMQVS